MKTNVRFSILSHTVLRRMRNVADKPCRENQNTHIIFNNRAFYEVTSGDTRHCPG